MKTHSAHMVYGYRVTVRYPKLDPRGLKLNIDTWVVPPILYKGNLKLIQPRSEKIFFVNYIPRW